MNFIVSSTTLLRHLQSISGVLNTSNNLPILDNFLFEIENGQLKVSASDLETTMITSLEVQSEENGKIAGPAKMLLDMLKNLPEQPCTFLVKENFLIEACNNEYILFFQHDFINECCTLQQTDRGIRVKDVFKLKELV